MASGIKIDSKSLLSVRLITYDASNNPITATTAIEITVDQLAALIGGSTGFVVPAATTTTNGGVKKTPQIADLAGGADLPTTVTKVNAILAALRTAGLITP